MGDCPKCGGTFESCACKGGCTSLDGGGPNSCPICGGNIPCLNHGR